MAEKNKMNQGMIMKALDYGYEKAVSGLPGFDTAEEIAESYMNNDNSSTANANTLIKWQIAKAGTSGFITGLGGILAMPVLIPANLASVLYIQIRMIAAIAYMGGHDLKDDRVRSLIFACLVGDAVNDILKNTGIVIGTKLTVSIIKKIPGKTLVEINQKVGFRLVTKFGEKGVINLGKGVPLLGGIIGGTFDSVTTKIIGNIARNVFIEK